MTCKSGGSIVPLIELNQSSRTNPGSVWFPEVSPALCGSTEFAGRTARNSNFPPPSVSQREGRWLCVILGQERHNGLLGPNPSPAAAFAFNFYFFVY